jgi:hypothetical protein
MSQTNSHFPLLVWDFENVMSAAGISTAVGVPTDPALVSGFISQTGGGPAEVFGNGVGTVFLTRHLGSNEVFLWFTLTRQVFVSQVTMRHWHNHNPGYPTHPNYRIQLQIDLGDGYVSCGSPLHISDKNSGGTDWWPVGHTLKPGSYKLRWHPQALKNKARDTSSEFFAFKDVILHGYVYEPAASPPRAAAPEDACDESGESQSLPQYVTVELGGVAVERLKVMASKFSGRCVRSGAEFAAGARIGFKHRSSLSEAQKLAIFGEGKANHVVVLLTPAEAGQGEVPGCEYDADVE